MEQAVLAMLEGLKEVIEEGEEPPIFLQDQQATLVILGSNSGIGGRGEGRGESGGRDEPTYSDSKPSYSEGEEEDKEDEEMADPSLEWMT